MWKIINDNTGEIVAHSIRRRDQARAIIRELILSTPSNKRHLLALSIIQ